MKLKFLLPTLMAFFSVVAVTQSQVQRGAFDTSTLYFKPAGGSYTNYGWDGYSYTNSNLGYQKTNSSTLRWEYFVAGTLIATNNTATNIWRGTNGTSYFTSYWASASSPGGGTPVISTNQGSGNTNTPATPATPVYFYAGTNNPNGYFTAGLGSLYHQFDAVTGTNLVNSWIKQSASGNTGWLIKASGGSTINVPIQLYSFGTPYSVHWPTSFATNAEGSNITQWPDLTGNNNVLFAAAGKVTMTANAVGGQPGVYFSGYPNGAFLSNVNYFASSSVNTNCTICIVFRDLNYSTGRLLASGTNNLNFSIVPCGNSFPAICFYTNNAGQYVACQDVATADTEIFTFRETRSGLDLWRNGRPASIGNNGPNGTGANSGIGITDGSLFIGDMYNGNAGWKGWVSAIVVYTNALSNPQISGLNDYLCQYFGIFNPELAMEGDSTFAGAQVPTVMQILKTYSTFYGVDLQAPCRGGSSVAYMSNSAALYLTHPHPGRRVWEFLTACVNGTDNTSLASITNTAIGLCNLAHANNWLTIGCQPFSNYYETNSPYVRTNWSAIMLSMTNYFDMICTNSIFGANGYYTNFGDGIHPGNTTYTNWIVTNFISAYKQVLAK